MHACRSTADLLARAALEAFADPAWRVSAPLPREEAWALAAAVAGSPLGARLSRVARAAAAERERLRAFVGEGASKFVLTPILPPPDWAGELATLRSDVPDFRPGPARTVGSPP